MMRTIRNPRRTAGVLTGILLAGAALALPPAYAAAPANDSILHAVAITPSTTPYVVQTREATASASDGECVGGSSVWYRYRPTATKRLRAVTLGSSYRTMLAVFTGPRTNRRLVGCNAEYGFSALELTFAAGRTYWIAVSKCCNRTKKGGRAVLRLYQPTALKVTTTVDAVVAGDVSGQLFVHATSTCTNPSAVYLSVFGSQRVGDGVAQGYNEFEEVACDPDGLAWEAPLFSQTGWAFRGGRVALSLDVSAFDGFASAHKAQEGIHDVIVDPNARRRP